MIKNLCIVILTLVVMVLFWMSFSSRSMKADVTDLGQKVLELKERLLKPTSAIIQEVNKPADCQGSLNHDLFRSSPGIKKGKDGLSKLNRANIFTNDTAGKGLFDNEEKPFKEKIEEKIHRKPAQEEILKDSKAKKPKKKSDDLTTQDISSILAILNSAQSLTKKSPLRHSEKPKDTPADNTNADAASIKKKLSIGLAESEG